MKKLNSDIELLSAYLDGELSPAEKKYIEDKIKSSLELQKELSDLKRLKELTASSTDKIAESPFFETRVFANLNTQKVSKFNIKKWIPISSLTLVTIALMVILKFNPNLIDDIIKQQKSNLEGFYKENLKPLLYAADLSNEDIFNFAVYQELPLDSTNNQVLRLGNDVKGSEYFEIKKASNVSEPNNLKKFVAALDFNEDEIKSIDSIISSYSDQISGLVLVNDKNSVAINPKIWSTRKLILADILSFAKKHKSANFNKIIPTDNIQFDNQSIAKWVNKAKAVKDNQYIFCTPDSIFKEDFVFDMHQFKKDMESMSKELAQLQTEKKVLRGYQFKVDSSFVRNSKNSDWTKQFKVFIDTNLIKVSVQNVAVDFPEINLPDFDSIATVIHEATQNIPFVNPPSPPVTVGKKRNNYEFNVITPKKKAKVEVNLDSLMQMNNLQNEKIRSEQKKRIQSEIDANQSGAYYTDSLIILQNKELKKEMDNLRKELRKFREDLKDQSPKNNDSIKKDSVSDVEMMEI